MYLGNPQKVTAACAAHVNFKQWTVVILRTFKSPFSTPRAKTAFFCVTYSLQQMQGKSAENLVARRQRGVELRHGPLRYWRAANAKPPSRVNTQHQTFALPLNINSHQLS